MNIENNTSFSSSHSLSRRQVRSVYLITYSRANSELVDSRNSFVRVVLDSFANADCKIANEVLQCACCEERHKDGGIHYHIFQKKSGKTDLPEFIANRGFIAVEDALKIGWELEQAPHDLERLSKTRMEILKGFLDTECATGCDKKWLDTA